MHRPERLRKVPEAAVAHIMGHLAHIHAAFLQQGQCHFHPLLAQVGGNAHAGAFAKALFQVALVGAHPPGQPADRQLGAVLAVDDVDGIIYRPPPAVLPALDGGGRQRQPLAQQGQYLAFQLQLFGQGHGLHGGQSGQQRMGLAHGGAHVCLHRVHLHDALAPRLQALLQQATGFVMQHAVG